MGLLGGIGDAFHGITGNIFKGGAGQAGYNPAEDDQYTKDALNRQMGQARGTDEQLASGYNRNTEDAGSFLRDDSPNSLGGEQDPAMKEALASRSRRKFDTSLNSIQRENKTKAKTDQANIISNAINTRTAINDRNAQVEQMQIQAEMNKKAARNAVIGSVLGGVGSVGGAIAGGMVGGPMGASAGSQVGGSLGGMAGSSQQRKLGS